MPEFLKGVGAARFGVMAGVAAALTAFFLYVANVISTPPQSILFAGLTARDASQITAKLDAMNVHYTLEGGGGTILVPADRVEKLRMDMASQNLPSAGVGYEIFDKSNTFGTSAFVERINELRALEGELTRSIETLDGIEAARVHLVLPRRQIFAQNRTPPSASVVLKVENPLRREQVLAIQHLVAAAVAGLQPSRVAIVDDHGDLLAGGDGNSSQDAMAAEQDQQTSDFESRMQKRIQDIVASVVGPGHVRVQVAADIKYNHTQQTSEVFDPNSKVPLSTQSVDQSSTNTEGQSNNAVSVANALPGKQQAGSNGGTQTSSKTRRSEETTNYEISKTTTMSVNDGGDLKRLSVAVVVDDHIKDLPGGKTKAVPLSAQELAQITGLVKTAIGYDKARGDRVEVVNMPFAHMDMGPLTPQAAPFLGLSGAYWFKIIEAAILSLTALLIGLFVARPLIRNMFAVATPAAAPGGAPAQLGAPQPMGQLPAPAGSPALPNDMAASQGALPAPASGGAMIDISRIEGQVRESSIRKVGEVVDAHPEEALAILRTWLHQPA
ncbi:MAG: flagellar M-ring protein FliF [Alphaproteobacteria bacterium]|nr:flagellar M-ring protein FliF [Alphaproteobacteria bacterium]